MALETKEELVRELDTLINQGFQNIEDHKRWMLDLDVAETAQMSISDMQFRIYKLEAQKAKDELVLERSN